MSGTAPNYSVDTAFTNLNNKYQGKTLQDVASHNIALTAYQVGSSGATGPIPWGPVLYHNLPLLAGPGGPPLGFAPTPTANLAAAITASSAMPGMLAAMGATPTTAPFVSPPQVDGAFLAHEPALAAIGLAVAAGVPLSQIVVLSIGAGLTSSYLNTDSSWGSLQWEGAAPPAAGNYGNLASFLVGGGISPVLSMGLNGTSALLIPQLAQLLLGDRYFCLSPELTPLPAETDCNEATISQLLAAADNAQHLLTAVNFVRQYWQYSSGPLAGS